MVKLLINYQKNHYHEFRKFDYDSFKEAAKELAKERTELYKAWYYDDFRKFIPSAYNTEYLDFSKYPLKYVGKQLWNQDFVQEEKHYENFILRHKKLRRGIF